MANTRATKDRVRRWATSVQIDAADTVAQSVSDATPVDSGALRRSLGRSEVRGGTRIVTRLKQDAAPNTPTQLPEWLDQNVQFPIVARPGGVLRFRVRGGEVVFAKRVRWRPRPESVGFWSRNVNARAWAKALNDAAGRTRF